MMAIRVNGHTISDEMIGKEMARMRSSYEQYVAQHSEQPSEEQLREWSEDNLVEHTLALQAAAVLIPRVPHSEVYARYKEIRGQCGDTPKAAALKAIDHEMRSDKMLQRVTESVPAPADEEIVAFYREHQAQFFVPERIKARHIVKQPRPGYGRDKVEAELREVRAKIVGGADFAELARLHSECPDRGGDLGVFGKGQMVEPFERVVFLLEPGQVSDVFETEFGLHIAQVAERLPAGPVPLEEVREKIVEHLRQEKQSEAVNAFLDSLKAKAVIERM